MATVPRAHRYDPDDVVNVQALLALDVEPPASFAFYLRLQFPAIADLLLEAAKTPFGMKLPVSADDWRLAIARKFGLLPVAGMELRSQQEESRKGFYLMSYGRAVRVELMMIEIAEGRWGQ